MKKTCILTIGFLTFFCILSFISSNTNGAEITKPTFYVGGNGPGNYTTIQDALDNITAGGTVYVYPGTYHENLMITTPVHLIGENTNTTIIDGDNTQYVVALDAGNSSLSGFTITHSEMKFPYAGIYVNSDHNTITNTILTGNFYGIQLGYGAQKNLIVNNTIFQNGRCGIYFNHASKNSLIGNIVFNHPVNGFGLYEFSDDNRITNNIFSNNREAGLNVRESYDNQVIGNTFIQNHVGFHTPAPEYHTNAHNNTFSNNGVALEEERDAFVFTVVVFDILVLFVFLVFKKLIT